MVLMGFMVMFIIIKFEELLPAFTVISLEEYVDGESKSSESSSVVLVVLVLLGSAALLLLLFL